METKAQFIARFGDGEEIVPSLEALDRCLTSVLERKLPELMLSPASPAKQLGSLALRVFGLKPRPAVVLHLGPAGAMITFRDRNGGDYRFVNRDFEGQATRGEFTLYDRRKVPNRLDEVIAYEPAFDLVRDFFREGDRPWRISCRPVAI